MTTADKRRCLEEAVKMMRMTDKIISHLTAPSQAEVDAAHSLDKIIDDFIKTHIV
jgi:hypothetical protein